MGALGTSHSWRHLIANYGKYRSPLAPAASDVETMRGAIADHDGQVLLLGVTPALAGLGQDLTALDRSIGMITSVWPANSPGRRAVAGNWLRMPCADDAFDAVIGDGVLCAVDSAAPALLREVRRVLRPGGAAAFRNFCSPARRESLEVVSMDVLNGAVANPHALKWRIAMSLAWRDEGFSVPVRDILRAFNDLFPDRRSLAERTGWNDDEISMIDAYAQAGDRYCFQPAHRMLAMAREAFGAAEIRSAWGYPMAECCPFLVLRP